MSEKSSRIELINPSGLQTPAAHYSQVAVVNSVDRFAFVSGQVGVDENGTVAADLDAEARLMWANVETALRSADFSVTSILKVTMYVVSGTPIDPPSRARAAILGSHKPASTLVYVSGLARPEWHYEVEVIAGATI